MPRSNIQQFDFRAGEWSPLAQGRANDPRYSSALSLCRNTIISEEGAAIRRPGTQRLAPTAGRLQPRFLKFISSTSCAFMVEATYNVIRFWDGAKLVFTNDARTVTGSAYTTESGGGYITLGLDAAHGWSPGDFVMLSIPTGVDEGTCRGRVFDLIDGTTGSTLVLHDDLGQPLTINPSNFTTNVSLVGASVYRIKQFTTPYSAPEVPSLRLVQAQTQGIILSATHPPYALQVTEPANTSSDPTFTFGALTFVDGPYLDPSGDTGTVSGYTGTITFTASTTTPFSGNDVGRHIRLFSQPAAYASGTTYATGDLVTDGQGEWWQSLIDSNTGNTPGIPVTISGVQQLAWVPAPTAGRWAWGVIASYVGSGNQITVTLDTSIPDMVLPSVNGTTISLFQLGVYNSAVGFPTCGVYFEGRLWLFGAEPNGVIGSVANGFNVTGLAANSWQMSPTDPYDNVLDDSGIYEKLNSTQINTIYWAHADPQGVLIGTNGGEWLLSASTLSDPITPTSIQIHRVTTYRSVDIEPAITPMALVYPQAYGRRIIEYLSDAFTQRYTGKPLNEDARHMTNPGVIRIDYQSEPTPVVWALIADGSLIGCTYRRISRFVTENPTIYAWHSHRHGGGAFGEIAILPAQAGSGDFVYLSVQDQFGWFVEMLTPAREVEPLQQIADGWFADSAPGGAISIGTTCGYLLPSIGVSGSSSGFSSDDWAGPTLTPTVLPAAGTVIPPAPAPDFSGFLVLKDGVYFNGYSAVYNTIPAHGGVTGVTGSFWLYFDKGLSTKGKDYRAQVLSVPGGLSFYPVIAGATYTDEQADLSFMFNDWINVLWCQFKDGPAQHNIVYINETPMQNYDNASGWLSARTIIDIALGLGQNADGYVLPDGNGLIAGMAEYWVDTNYLDITDSTNRAKFHCTDLSGQRFAPVDLGPEGKTPTGTCALYLSGNNDTFRYNRAFKNSKVTTYNNGGFELNFDPDEVKLDPLPADIAPIE